MFTNIWASALSQVYLHFYFFSLFALVVFGFFFLIFSWQNNRSWLGFWYTKYSNLIVSLQFGLLYFTIFIIFFNFFVTLKTGQTFKFLVSILNADFSFFYFSLTSLNLFFLFMLSIVALLTTISFRTSRLEEQTVKQIQYFQVKHKEKRELFFNFQLILLQFLLFIFFSTEDVFIFFISFESSVLPLFAIIAFFGKRSQKFKALAYLLYFTLLSAVPMFAVTIWLNISTGSSFYPEIQFLVRTNAFDFQQLLFCFLAFFIPFSVKFAFFPLHSWLPEAHVEASTEGSMLLSGVMLKLGFFGLIKYCIGLFPGALFLVAPFVLSLALIGSFAATLATYHQIDVKKIIAYSSVVHMNLSLFGYLTLSSTALQAAIFMNFSHAIISAGLFSSVGVLQDRVGTRMLPELCGLSKSLPIWSQIFFVLLLANAGVPGTVGFIAEAPLIWGCFTHFPYCGFLMLFPVSLMAFRNFVLFAQICWGVPYNYLTPVKLQSGTESKGSVILAKIWDISIFGEGFTPVVFAILAVFLGIWPNFVLHLLNETAFQLENWYITFNKNLYLN